MDNGTSKPAATPPPQPKPSRISTTAQAARELQVLVSAHYPLIWIVSAEEARVESVLRAAMERLDKRVVVPWTCTQGFVRLVEESHKGAKSVIEKADETRDPLQALTVIAAREGGPNEIYLLKDFDAFLDDAAVVRGLRDLATLLTRRMHTKLAILATSTTKLPPSLAKDVAVLDFPLPDIDVIKTRVSALAGEASSVQYKPSPDAVYDACRGLTAQEIENVVARSMATTREVSASVVAHEKGQIVRKQGLLEIEDCVQSAADVGGLENLVAWLRQRRRAAGDRGRAFGLPAPKGALAIGPPGTGKTLIARVAASIFGVPLLRWDLSRLMGSLLGQTEERTREALKLAEAIAPCVLLMDEIEKILASGGHDGGAAMHVLQQVLTWLQDRTAPVFVMATANRVAQGGLPPELTRRGRFDQIFFVDLPNERERAAILDVHIRGRGRDPGRYDLPHLASMSQGHSGAELEQAVVDALYFAFDDGERDLSQSDLEAAVRDVTPLSVSMASEVEYMREFGKKFAKPASASPPAPGLVAMARGITDLPEETSN